MRDFLAKNITAFGLWISPPEVKRFIEPALNIATGLAEEVAKGGEGGVAILAWGITDKGRELSSRQADACKAISLQLRKEFENAHAEG